MAPDRNPIVAGAIRLLEHLAEYTEHVRKLAAQWPPDRLVHAQAHRLMDVMQIGALRIPELRIPWACFVISHCDMIQLLWSNAQCEARLDAVEAHVARILEVEAVCLQVAAAGMNQARLSPQ